ncbi:MAG TPA: hypothetical protein DCG90_00360 [Sphingobium sp.]|uniref:hypothetical protein n=1 Tax=unclassified Sphingobium TaxID=2611147 RepID=UPI0007F548A6|nr:MULTISPECIES: hypothetical protein [unclassified Sphingobium]OAN53336.1 hypothetical protein A7Q26_04725 [Sphingobium sp. TCM1]WIW87271.1 hypothetical protein K3M67_09735 [Sphingobium sp. V4]HAF40223.1 hypothetical protein [Sphingobium sp.]
MAEPKPLASLTSGLLARKGAAQPAMRRPMLGFGRGAAVAIQQDDLGWNDMGFDVEPTPEPVEQPPVAIGLTPMGNSVAVSAPVPAVVAAREELAERIGATQERAQPVTTAAPARSRKAAFTLRLDADRHLRLRLASAVTGRSAQQMVTEALDNFLSNLPDVDRLTQQLPHMRGGA